jgi:uncharacterized protein YuzE
MSIKIDFTADAAYVFLPEHEGAHSARTIPLSYSVLVDYDAMMRPIGVEIIGLQTEIPIGALVRLGITDQTIRELLSLSSASLEVSQ